ncbi:MAG: flavodoxin [Candidatus Heimdallarchaeota archaeon]|nr:flavodoxin [Candidatus Heimdallarchaeota archaeon]
MLKKLVIYYTFEGDTKFIGDAIAETIDADILELELVKDDIGKDYVKHFLGERQVLMKTKPLLKPFNKDITSYDLLVIGTPVWSGTYAPALRTFFSETKITGKKIALFYCFTVKPGRISKRLRKALKGNKIIAEIGFKDPLKHDKEKDRQKAQNWAKENLAKLD